MARGGKGKQDANTDEIVDAYKELKCSVERIGHLVTFADLLVCISGVTEVVEIKNPKQKPSARRLTDNESKFMARWGSYTIVETVDDVIAHVARVRAGK